MEDNNSDLSEWYEKFVKPHEAMIRHWISSRYGLYCDVEEVMQEALLQLFNAYRKHKIESPKSYFYAIARNTAVSQIRKSKVRVATSLYDEDALEIIDEHTGVDEIASRNYELEILTRAIQSLPERCQQVFTLNKVYGMSYDQIAKKLGISSHTVRNQLVIGLSKCTEYMYKHAQN